MKKRVFTVVVVAILMLMLVGCSESEKVSHNISLQADNFNVVRRLTVINTRTDKCLLQMTGKISIQDVPNGIAVLVEVDPVNSIYQKHYVYMNDNTMYTLEDVTGVGVSKYSYELEFMPQMLNPVRIRTGELKSDLKNGYHVEEEIGEEIGEEREDADAD